MADNTLEAFQIGASLYDRAQTQRRMMEQLQLQTAQQVMQRENYDIQNKTASYNLSRSMDDQAKFAVDLPKIQAWQSAYVQWNAKGDPTAAFPAPPTDLQSATGLKMLGDMSGPVIQSLPMAQNRFLLEKANASQFESLNNEIKFLNEHGKSDIPLQYNGGLDPKTGKINPESRIAIFAAAAPLREKEARLKELSTTALTGQRNTREGLTQQLISGAINQQEYDELFPTARPEGGFAELRTQKNLANLVDEGLVDPNNKTDFANASRIVRSNIKTPTKVIDSITASDKAIFQLDNAIDKINQFDSKYGKGAFNEYVGPIDSPLFKATAKFKGLTSAEKQTARAIQQQIGMVLQDYRKGVFGATLTPNEQVDMENIAGTTGGNDYVFLTSGFNENLKRGIGKSITNNRYDAAIPLDLKKTYAPEIFVGGATPATPSVGQPAGSGIKIISTEILGQ